MIPLTRLNNSLFTLNALMIEQVETLPDTTITLISGKKLVVKNTKTEVIQLTIGFYREIGLQRSLKGAGKENHE